MRRALLVAWLFAAPAVPQQEPTPFWLPPPPPSKKAPAKPGKPAKPAKKKKKPVQLEPLEMKESPPPVVQKPKPPAKKPPSEPTWIESPRAAEPAPPPPARPNQAPVEIEPAPPEKRAPAEVVTPPPVEKHAPAEIEPSPSLAPQVRAPSLPPAVVVPAPPPEPVPPVVVAEPEPEPEPAAPDFRRWSGGLSVGAWAKSRSDGGSRAWDLAYGARFGFALYPSIELEMQLVRAGGGAGSPFVSAQATHNLAALRAFWVLGGAGDGRSPEGGASNLRLALLLGAGGGVALAQTHYTLLPSTDPGVVATGLDANAVKTVIEITAAGRARVFRGLEARAEVSAMARDGRLELLPLLGLGAAF